MDVEHEAGLTEDDFDPVGHPVADRVVTGAMTLLPALGLVWAVRIAWGGPLRWQDLVVFAIMYLLTGVGITVGFHRLLTHRSFSTRPLVRGVLAALGSAV